MEPSSSLTTPEYKEWQVLCMTTLTSIATVIGSGILALPVTLHATCLSTFLILFTIVLISISFVVCSAVDILHITLVQRQSIPTTTESNTPLLADADADANNDNNDGENGVSLFEMATLYIPNMFLRVVFHVSTLMTFLSLLVSYGLAGPQAVIQLFSTTTPPPIWLLFTYSTILLIMIILFTDILIPTFSTLTVIKGTLFITVVILVSCLPSSVKIYTLPQLLFMSSPASSISSMIVPFLMGTVALGALPNTMPITFNLLPTNPTQKQIKKYRMAVLLGLFICYLLNVGWIIALMQVVPQDSKGKSNANLTYSFNHGQISTVPLIQILSTSSSINGTMIQYVVVFVNLFVLISAVVSFFAMGAGCKNYIDGAIFYFFSKHRVNVFQKSGVYLLIFGGLILTIVWNPNGFIQVLTNVTSFTMNLQSGVFIFIMLFFTKRFHHTGGVMNNSFANVIMTVGFAVFVFACLLVVIPPFLLKLS